jgi:error-prone DNA polymerase
MRTPFVSIDDLVRRVPGIRKDELRMLARVGALNSLGQIKRRDALWDAERARRAAGPLFSSIDEPAGQSPLEQMTMRERLHADFSGTGLTVGRHPMAYFRDEVRKRGARSAIELMSLRDGMVVKVAGAVIVRQRPGTANGFLFISLEDETGVANIIVDPPTYNCQRDSLVNYPFLLFEGVLQNWQGSVSVKAGRVEVLDINAIPIPVVSHDFH